METKLGVIVGNRGFFPDQLVESGRREVLETLDRLGVDAVVLDQSSTAFGSVETYEDARACAELFQRESKSIDGILVTLPNFGDERAVADAIRLSGLSVPILVHAFPDDPRVMGIENRRDSFCGKISVCNNLNQYGIPFSLTANHTEALSSDAFEADMEWFRAVCRVVKGLRNARIGAIGARPGSFNTVRYSEKLLEFAGIAVNTLDLSEIIGKASAMKDGDSRVEEKLEAIRTYTCSDGVPDVSLQKMAKLGVVIDQWMDENQLSAAAIQCWTAMEEFYGIVPCTLMSMMSNSLLPAACEVDVTGVIGMYALQLASAKPSALLDWNNNFGDDPNKTVLFHCSNLPKAVFEDFRMDYQAIIAGSVGKQNTYGTVVGRVKPGTFTYARVMTDDISGSIQAYTGEGQFTGDDIETFGGFGVARIPDLQGLLQYICKSGFEHHVAVNLSKTARAIEEAFETYLGFEVYNHGEIYQDS